MESIWNAGPMARPSSPEVRTALIERAATMLAQRQPVTLRSVVAGTGVSTMAVYTHFDGMDGLWRAVRQEGFSRLAATLEGIEPTRDPIRDVMVLGATYVRSAMQEPDLYRVMFDATIDLEDPAVAASSFDALVGAMGRAVAVGRLRAGTDPVALATRWWVVGHGLVSLVLNGALPPSALSEHVVPMAVAIFVDAGDRPDRCRRSVRAGWSVGELPEPPPVAGRASADDPAG